MAQGIGLVSGLGFVADGAGVGGVALGGAVGSGHNASVPGVAGGGDALGVGVAAVSAGVGLHAIGGAGGGGGHSGVAMAGGRDLTLGYLTADGAGVVHDTGGGAVGENGLGTFVVDMFTAEIVRGGHGVSGVEALGIVFRVADVVGEIVGAHQEVGVSGLTGIPGGVQVVVQVVDLCDVPTVGYTFDFFFEGDVEETEAPTEAPTEEATEAPTEEDTTVSTDTPTETTIEAPTEAPAVTDDNAVTTEAPTAAPAGGCGSVMTLAILPCLAAGFVLTSKKKED